jgi:hypothetical protein
MIDEFNLFHEYGDAGGLTFSGVFPKFVYGVALTTMESYVNGAILQRRRIKEWEEDIKNDPGTRPWEKLIPRNK